MCDLADTITGVGKRPAEEIIAEIGADVSCFPTVQHSATWAMVNPNPRVPSTKTSVPTIRSDINNAHDRNGSA